MSGPAAAPGYLLTGRYVLTAGRLYVARREHCPRCQREHDVYEVIHIAPQTVTRHAATGRLPHLRTPGGLLFPEAAARELAAELATPEGERS